MSWVGSYVLIVSALSIKEIEKFLIINTKNQVLLGFN